MASGKRFAIPKPRDKPPTSTRKLNPPPLFFSFAQRILILIQTAMHLFILDLQRGFRRPACSPRRWLWACPRAVVFVLRTAVGVRGERVQLGVRE